MHKYQHTTVLRQLIEMLGDTNHVPLQFSYAVSNLYYTAPNDWLVHEECWISTVGVPTEIRTGHLPHVSQKRHHLSHLARWHPDDRRKLQRGILRSRSRWKIVPCSVFQINWHTQRLAKTRWAVQVQVWRSNVSTQVLRKTLQSR
jgi:hypothetical protein